MTAFAWNAYAYGLLVAAALGMEIRHQREYRYRPMPLLMRELRTISVVALLAWPLVLGALLDDSIPAWQSLALAMTPLAWLILFAAHMGFVCGWAEYFDNHTREEHHD